MILRIAAVLSLVTILAGGTWYFFRDTPAKRVNRWRDLVQEYLENDDLDEAEFWQDEILKYSSANHDKMIRAEIGMRKGTNAGIREAIEMYDLVLASDDPRGQIAALHRARALRALGEYSQAYNCCLSVMDRFPFAATMFMGETATAAMNPWLALNYYSRALKFASDENVDRRARVRCGIADSYLLLLRLNSAQPDFEGLDDEEAGRRLVRHERALEGFRKRAADALYAATALVIASDPTTKRQAHSNGMLLANLFLKLGNVRKEGEIPCYTGSVRVDEYIRKHRDTLDDVAPELLVRIGALHLRAAHEEQAHLTDKSDSAIKGHIEKAEKNFAQSLRGLSPDTARELLDGAFETDFDDRVLRRPGRGPFGKHSVGDDEIDRRREYIRSLAAVVNVYMRVGLSKTVLEGDSFLELRRRVKDAQAVDDTSVRRLFEILEGFALLRADRSGDAKDIFDAYIASVSDDERPVVLFRLADRCHDILPDSPVPLEYLARFEEVGGGPFDRLGPRVDLLIKIRARKATAKKASALLAETTRCIREAAKTLEEHLIVSHVLDALEDSAVVTKWLETAREKFGHDERLQRALLAARGKRANDLVQSGKTDEAIEFYRRSLGDLFSLYARDPTADDEVQAAIVGTIRALDSLGGSTDTGDPLSEVFPSTPKSTRTKIARSLSHLFRSDGKAVREELEGIEESNETGPILSFARGKSILVSATPGDRTKALAAATAEFQRHPDFGANRIELFTLALANIPLGTDVDDTLFNELREFEKEDRSRFVGKWLLADALRRRLNAAYHDESLKNSDVARVLLHLQSTLRELIREKPTFTPAYLALAESFTTGELDASVEKKRELFDIEYHRAIAVLRAVPRPTEPVLVQLSAYLERSASSPSSQLDDAQKKALLREAADLLEVVTLLQPTQSHYRFLVGVYVDLEAFDAAEILLGVDKDRPPLAPSAKEFGASIAADLDRIGAIPGLRIPYFQRLVAGAQLGDDAKDRYRALLEVLRLRFDSITNAEAIRHLYIAHICDAQKADATPRHATSLHAKMISHYEKSLAAFRAEKIEPPLAVLNNLAWHLVESNEPEQRKRGLELATLAVGRVPDHRQASNVHDTLAWALYRNGQLTEAEARLRRVLEDVDTPTYRYHLANVLVSLKRFDEALSTLRQALDSAIAFPEENDARRLESHIRTLRTKTRETPRTVGALRRIGTR